MTAQDYIYRMLETYPIANCDAFRIVKASDKQVEACMIAFAQEKVKEALEAAKNSVDDNVLPNCDNHTPYWGECQTCGRYDNPTVIRDEEAVKQSILKSYPLENVK